jgi:hypothetical protein
MTYNDDIFMGWLGIGPQIDGLGHIGIDHVYYNGHKDSDFAKTDGLTKLGIEKIPPIVARGVLLDMAGYYGVEMVEEGRPYTREDIIGAAEKQGVEIRQGRRRVVPFRLARPARWRRGGSKAVRQRASRVSARPAPNTSSNRRSSRSAATPGASKRFRFLRAWACSRFTRC